MGDISGNQNIGFEQLEFGDDGPRRYTQKLFTAFSLGDLVDKNRRFPRHKNCFKVISLVHFGMRKCELSTEQSYASITELI